MPGEKSLQHKLDRVRPPRVQITYDVETGGAQVKKELPFVLGVMSDLAGHPDPDQDHEALKDRQFVEINRDNFGRIMNAMKPRLAIRVDNQLEKNGSKIGLVLNFSDPKEEDLGIDAFSPENIVKQVEPLRLLLEARQKLADLKTKVVSNDKLDNLLQRIIKEAEEAKRQAATLASAAAAIPAETTPEQED